MEEIVQTVLQFFQEITIIDYCLMGGLMALFLYQVYFYARYIAGVRRKNRKQKKHPQTEDKVFQPGVSIIVCAHNEETNLKDYVQSLLTQDYPEYEIIIVNDGSEDKTRETIEELIRHDRRIKTTFVPQGARVNSTKKLAITLASKRALYDYLLLTDADCRPESSQWISEMMHGFANPETEVVIGFGAYYPENTGINRLIQYDTLFCGLQYMGMAIAHHPYMGVGRNLAYKKDLFVRTGGFSTMMNERAGDDDLFVNRVATRTNTAVITSRESMTWSLAKENKHDWFIQKRRHVSVSPNYSGQSKFRLALEPMTRGAFYLMFLLSAIGHPVSWAAAVVLFVSRLIMQLNIINTSARQMGLPGFGLRVIWYDIYLPLVSLWILTSKRKNYRW